MKSRLFSGLAGLAVLVFTAVTPQIFRASEIAAAGSLGGYLTPAGISLGVYLLFYSMTGEWLPRLRKRKTRS